MDWCVCLKPALVRPQDLCELNGNASVCAKSIRSIWIEKKGLEKWKDKHDESVNLFRAGLVLVNYWSDPFSPLLCCSWCSIQQAGKMLLVCRHLISI